MNTLEVQPPCVISGASNGMIAAENGLRTSKKNFYKYLKNIDKNSLISGKIKHLGGGILLPWSEAVLLTANHEVRSARPCRQAASAMKKNSKDENYFVFNVMSVRYMMLRDMDWPCLRDRAEASQWRSVIAGDDRRR